MSSASYVIRSPLFCARESFGLSFIRDMPRGEAVRSVKFHVESGDYFGTLATLMRLMADAVATGDAHSRARCVATLKELSEDLVYLQSEYVIKKK